MPDRDYKRLMLAIRFEYQSSLFVILDIERKGNESFSFLLARYKSDEDVNDRTLIADVQAAVEKLRQAKGILGNTGIDQDFCGAQFLKHQKETHESIVRVRRSYFLSKLDCAN